ncbi:CPBP family intramembrane metalloprotease [Corallococcus sp. AB011P]|uniref:CPBP family intramembrane glutamic endopeptidase n=1 Tax=unclassified Corallococcus TaxID=2685029 RepID=UPI000EA2AF52|nr:MULTISPECIES: type II CAAX endopeptidase family protein [unclassified Corallococcus]RKG59054.1 CPBP family intramembrane metalloprotease [Corallococcus sp. AB011P]RKH87836.1 CPBP family intramembrane metalloprotease [Corallococcus sp. AB045]
MSHAPSESSSPPGVALRYAFAFAVLFACYEAPEGIGGRVLGSFAVTAALMLLFHAVAWGVGRWLGYRNGFHAYALEWRGSALARALAVMLVLKPLSVLVGVAVGVMRVQPLEKPLMGTTLLVAALGVAVSTFVPSVAEDIVARGFWYRAWPVAGQGAGYVALSAGVFVLTHVYRLGNGPLEWLMLFCTGLAYAAAVARTGSLWGAVGLHWGWNLANALLDLQLDINAVGQGGRVLSAVTGLVALGLVGLLPKRRGSTV